MNGNKVCPKCEGIMKVGNYTGVIADWENEGKQNFLKESGHKIVTYACEACGYMESYVKK